MRKEPKEKLTLKLPEGTIGVRHAACPGGCDMMDASVPIHGLPSIRVRYSIEEKEGILHLDPLYGSFENIHEWDPPAGAIAEFGCPSCGCSLRVPDETCQLCAGPLFALRLPSGIVEGCLRRGCHYHRMTIVDVQALMERLFSQHALDSYL